MFNTEQDRRADDMVATAPNLDGRAGSDTARRVLDLFSFKRISAAYILVALIIVFGFWIPVTFLEIATLQQVLNSNAVIALGCLALCIPLAAGVYDLSFAYTMTLASVIVARLVYDGWSVWAAIVIALGASLVVGVVNGIVIVGLRVESLIATLATGSLIQAFVSYVTGNETIQGGALNDSFARIGQASLLGVTLPVVYVLVAAFAVWYLLQHTSLGRQVYAAGFNADAAKLVGVKTKHLQFGSLMCCAFVSGVAGIVLASILGSADPSAGVPYLLPAFAAVFLGSTQITPGRFNAWGSILAVLMLGTGIVGLSLANAPQWAADMFTGIVLISALALSVARRRGSA